MAYEIEWTANAIEDLKQIVEYLKDEWPLDVADQFVEKPDSILELLIISPYPGRPSKKENGVRQILITRHNRLYYLITGNQILLLDFFDTRQNPEKDLF
ncbi:MAG: type II toxin-antitoxin system RelE/ParE family toxin [bacterium]|nr:type II toxin-antitoxin system RelE/ParE family toxin [bacterium]